MGMLMPNSSRAFDRAKCKFGCAEAEAMFPDFQLDKPEMRTLRDRCVLSVLRTLCMLSLGRENSAEGRCDLAKGLSNGVTCC